MCAYMCVRMYIYTHIYTHTHTQKYKHLKVQPVNAIHKNTKNYTTPASGIE